MGLWIYCRPDYDVLCDCSDHATNLNIGSISQVSAYRPWRCLTRRGGSRHFGM
jgi:hypothetical protein